MRRDFVIVHVASRLRLECKNATKYLLYDICQVQMEFHQEQIKDS